MVKYGEIILPYATHQPRRRTTFYYDADTATPARLLYPFQEVPNWRRDISIIIWPFASFMFYMKKVIYHAAFIKTRFGSQILGGILNKSSIAEYSLHWM